jgi:hypothetical protein
MCYFPIFTSRIASYSVRPEMPPLPPNIYVVKKQNDKLLFPNDISYINLVALVMCYVAELSSKRVSELIIRADSIIESVSEPHRVTQKIIGSP